VGRATRSVASNLNRIRPDFGDIVKVVGTPGADMGHDGDRSIHGHARSIDCQIDLAIPPPDSFAFREGACP
jgi:hypothetical protein